MPPDAQFWVSSRREDWDSTTVGRVGHALVLTVLATGRVPIPENTWLLSTYMRQRPGYIHFDGNRSSATVI